MLERARWLFEDHIRLGESRAIVRTVELAVLAGTFSRKLLVLEDNRPAAGAMTKEDRELDELLVTVKTGKLERLQQLVSRMHVPIVTPQAAAPCYPYQYLTVSQVQSAVATYSASLNRCEDTSPKVRVRSSTVECVL